MKKVSFEIAKALKEAGYPQAVNEEDSGRVDVVFSNEPDNYLSYEGAEIQGYLKDQYLEKHNIEYCIAPTYLETWIWLWNEKEITIDVDTDYFNDGNGARCFVNETHEECIGNSPEEAIVTAINYLVEHNLIK